MSKNIVFEGWLTKSPPLKRIWKTKWRRRWFALRQSGELPGQYFLDYYADRNCRRLKGTINLDLCEQVDAGLHMERTGSVGALDPKIRGSVFTIQTQSRIYHLEADCEADMEKWVDAICRVCGLRATDEAADEGACAYQISTNTVTVRTAQNADSTGPYIAISECITGVRAQDSQKAFTFDPKNIVTSSKTSLERVGDSRENQMYTSQPQIRVTEFSENESTLSEDECKSLNASQSNIRGEFSVAKSFTKLHINRDKGAHSEEGPPVPPRPPKTFAMSREMFPNQFPPKAQEIADTQDPQPYGLRIPRRMSQGGVAPPSPVRARVIPTIVVDDVEELHSPQSQQPSMQYCNLPNMPPAVDRALKPRSYSYTMTSSAAPTYTAQAVVHFIPHHVMKSDVLQYLDLDLEPKNDPSKPQDPKKIIIHGKSDDDEPEPAYKTVDFVKTEAFNITRQDAEASRSNY